MVVTGGELIGLFDSGLGGVTVLEELRALLPFERFVYLGDLARLPYGTKSPETIKRYARECAEFLVKRGCSIIVVACNTASAVALDALVNQVSVPIVGAIRPAVRSALTCTKNGVVGVLATNATVASGVYEEILRRTEPTVTVLSQACPLFVPLVESGVLTGPIVEHAVAMYCTPLKEAGVDTVILGCTHYPLLAPVIQAFFGPEVAIIESSKSLAEDVASLVASRGGARQPPSSSVTIPCEFCVTDDVGRFNYLANTYLSGASGGGKITAQRVDL